MTKEEAIATIDFHALGIYHVDESTFYAGWDAAIESISEEKEREKIPFDAILETMNQILGKKFKATLACKSHIRARWGEGMREEDFERVIRIKKAQWSDDPKFCLYLRPETLFGTKMDAYNNEPEPKKKKIITNHMGIETEVDDENT
jgi:uncharacterized phage protein (TIGR02220 family)